MVAFKGRVNLGGRTLEAVNHRAAVEDFNDGVSQAENVVIKQQAYQDAKDDIVDKMDKLSQETKARAVVSRQRGVQVQHDDYSMSFFPLLSLFSFFE